MPKSLTTSKGRFLCKYTNSTSCEIWPGMAWLAAIVHLVDGAANRSNETANTGGMHAGNLDTVTAYFQKVALVAVPGRRAGPWQDAMNDGCAARLGTLPQSPAVMLLERPEHPAASEILSPGRPDSGWILQTIPMPSGTDPPMLTFNSFPFSTISAPTHSEGSCLGRCVPIRSLCHSHFWYQHSWPGCELSFVLCCLPPFLASASIPGSFIPHGSSMTNLLA